MPSYKKDTIAMLDKFSELLKKEAVTIDLGCGAGSYEFVAVEDIDYVFDEMVKEYEQQ